MDEFVIVKAGVTAHPNDSLGTEISVTMWTRPNTNIIL